VVDVTSTGTIASKLKVKAKTAKSEFDVDAASGHTAAAIEKLERRN
jgi:hypothetical protein